MAVRQVVRAVGAQVVAVRPQVVVDHIENDRKSEAVGLVHKAAQVVGPAVAPRWSKQLHAIVSPVPLSGEVGDRHQLDRRHAELRQVRQLLGRRGEGAGGRERTDVEFVQDQLAKGGAAPAGVGPSEAVRVHHLGRAVNALRLTARGRIGIRPLAVHAVAVALAGANARDHAVEVAVGCLVQPVGGAAPRRSHQDDFDHSRRWGPDTEARSVFFRPGAQRRLPHHAAYPRHTLLFAHDARELRQVQEETPTLRWHIVCVLFLPARPLATSPNPWR
jgi:hypothetical protein